MSEDVRELSLYQLDVLPGHCSMQAQVVTTGRGMRVRFQATRPRGWRQRAEVSGWSGWFAYEGEPIALCWDTFWPVI